MKNSILLLLVFGFFSVSFYSQPVRAASLYTSVQHAGWNGNQCFPIGSVFSSSYVSNKTCRTSDGVDMSNCYVSGGYVYCKANHYGTITNRVKLVRLSSASSCPDGKVLDSDGLCDTPPPTPTCEDGQVWNEQTESCDLAPDTEGFCGSSEFVEIHASEGNACAAQYPDHFTDLNFTCDNRQNYSFTCNKGIERPPEPTDPDPTDPDPTDPDPTDPDPTDPDPTDPDPTDPDPTDPDPADPDPTDPDPTDPDPTDPDPTPNPDPTYNNGGNAHGSGSSGGTASASDGNVSVDISFDGVHNRLDAVNDNLAGTNERIETTNNLLNDFSNRHDQNSKKTRDAIGNLNKGLGDKIDKNGKSIVDAVGGLGDKLDDISDGSNTSASDGGCGVGDFSCDGNSYECYIARVNWKNRCLMQSLTGDPLVPIEGVPLDSLAQVSESGDALINDLQSYSSTHLDPDKLSNGDVLITDSLDKFNESNGLSFDEKCPAPNVVDTGMGVFTIDYTPFCDLALYVRAMLMLFASIGSILMISKFS